MINSQAFFSTQPFLVSAFLVASDLRQFVFQVCQCFIQLFVILVHYLGRTWFALTYNIFSTKRELFQHNFLSSSSWFCPGLGFQAVTFHPVILNFYLVNKKAPESLRPEDEEATFVKRSCHLRGKRMNDPNNNGRWEDARLNYHLWLKPSWKGWRNWVGRIWVLRDFSAWDPSLEALHSSVL